MNMINLTPLFQAIIALLCAVITPRLVRWLNAKLDAADREELQFWTKLAVAAAEQLFKRSEADLKKQYVFDFLNERGFTIDFDEIDKAIEAAVLELHAGLYGKNGGDTDD